MRLAFAALALLASSAQAAPDCKGLPDHKFLQHALTDASVDGNGGLFKPNLMWAVVVNRQGVVCAVAKTGDAWPGSRLIAAAKAVTANGFSNDQLAISTANVYAGSQPGGFLFGIQAGSPLNPAVAGKGNPRHFGSEKDPLIGEAPGGAIVFGGGLALYGADGKTVLGALGLSGDTSCTDHIIAWRMREAFKLGNIPAGPTAAKDDNIVYDLDANGKSPSGFGHPVCSPAATTLGKALTLKREKP